MSNYSNCSNKISTPKSQKFWSLRHWVLFRSIRLIRLISFGILVSFFFLFAPPVNAVCPVCTVAVGGGVLLSRYLGVDDLIIGVWVGGLLVSLGLWMASYLKKNFIFGQKWLVVVAFWLTTYFGFKQAKIIGNFGCKIFGYDKILLGMVLGAIAFLIGFGLDKVLRNFNKETQGKALFPYQKVICPVSFLLLATLISLQLCKLGIK